MARPLPILDTPNVLDITHLDSIRTYVEYATGVDPSSTVDWETYYTIYKYCQDP